MDVEGFPAILDASEDRRASASGPFAAVPRSAPISGLCSQWEPRRCTGSQDPRRPTWLVTLAGHSPSCPSSFFPADWRDNSSPWTRLSTFSSSRPVRWLWTRPAPADPRGQLRPRSRDAQGLTPVRFSDRRSSGPGRSDPVRAAIAPPGNPSTDPLLRLPAPTTLFHAAVGPVRRACLESRRALETPIPRRDAVDRRRGPQRGGSGPADGRARGHLPGVLRGDPGGRAGPGAAGAPAAHGCPVLLRVLGGAGYRLQRPPLGRPRRGVLFVGLLEYGHATRPGDEDAAPAAK